MHPGIGGCKLMQEPTNGEVGTKVGELQWHIGNNFKDQIERRIDWRIIKEKNPMSRSQWRRHQRIKKSQKEYRPREAGESSSNQVPYQGAKLNKPPVERRLFEAEKLLDEEEKMRSNSWKEEDRMTNDFDSDGVSSINLNCNVVSVL